MTFTGAPGRLWDYGITHERYWDVPHFDIASPEKRLERLLGVAHHVGSDLCFWVLNSNGDVLVGVVQDDCDDPEINLKNDKFNNRLEDEIFIIEGTESKMYL